MAGFWDTLGGGISAAFGGGGSTGATVFSNLGDTIGGTGTTPGLLGTGQYHPVPFNPATGQYDYGEQALQDSAQHAQQLGNTALLHQAPTMQAASAGRAATVNPNLAVAGPASQAGPVQIGSANLINPNDVRQTLGTSAQGFTSGGATVGVNGIGTSNQENAVNLLGQAAEGKGPSAAQSQLTAATDANVKQQMALAASLGGRNPAEAQRIAMQNAADVQQKAANQSAVLRAQEMQSAQNEYAGAAAGARTQDINLGTTNANLRQGNEQFNAQDLQAAAEANAARGQQNQQFNATSLNTVAARNQDAQNAVIQQQALMDQQRAVQNALLRQQQSQFGTTAGINVGEYNAGATTQGNQFNANLLQGANTNNLNANVTNTGQGYGFATNMLGQAAGDIQHDVNNEQAANELAVRQNIGLSDIQSGAYNAARGGIAGTLSNTSQGFGMLATGLG